MRRTRAFRDGFRYALPMIGMAFFGHFAAAKGVPFTDHTLVGCEKPMHYFATKPVEQGDACALAVVIVHGWGDGVALPKEVSAFAKAVRARGEALPYIVAPVFPRKGTMDRFKQPDDGRARWNDSMLTARNEEYVSAADDWRGGGDAAGTTMSSFDVIDRMFACFKDRTRYPNLTRVVLAGFSAGGQFAWRYAGVGKGDVGDATLEYAPMSPSTVLRLEPEVKWLYGLKNPPRYAAGMTKEQVLANFEKRRVWFGCGTKDVLKKPRTSLDDRPEAQAQGENRFDRFTRFEAYLAAYPNWKKNVTFHAFEGLGHEYMKAYADAALLDFILKGKK